MAPEQGTRRFSPAPIETSHKSSSKSNVTEKPTKADGPRKFAVQPIEESTKSSKRNGDTKELPERPARKFAVEPVEQSQHSSRQSDTPSIKPKSRFTPQPVETTTKHRRQNGSHGAQEAHTTSASEKPPDKPRRTFTPQLIDTSSRTRKTSDFPQALPVSLKTDVTPGHIVSAGGVPVFSADREKSGPRNFLMPQQRRKDRSDSHSSRRSHSFISPDLETIESSESEPSNPPSLSTSPSTAAESPITTSDAVMSEMYKHATRIRESVDESFSRYMLEIEAKRAEMRLREQALAAFPNSDFHEPVAHYVDEDEGSDEMEVDDRPATWEGHDEEEEQALRAAAAKTFRKDTTKYNWELQEIKSHHQALEHERLGRPPAKKESSTPSPWWKPAANDFAKAQDTEYSNMRDRARPPMLGDDLVFPRSTSPDPARFDVTQGSKALREQMCYLTEIAEANASPTNPKTADGLWGQIHSPSKAGSGRSNQSGGGGLWGGFCVDTTPSNPATPGLKPGLTIPSGPTGLMTPAPLEPKNPFDSSAPPTPLETSKRLDEASMVRLDSVLNTEMEIDSLMSTEYDDRFITQVFNYLSLGYPSLARSFDEELAKIGGVPISELRADDALAKSMPKGYIRLGDDLEGRGDGSDQCLNMDNPPARWRALKGYIKEWVRQEKGMVSIEAFGGMGTAPRRGSWAW